jgi:hypothetical protein
MGSLTVPRSTVSDHARDPSAGLVKANDTLVRPLKERMDPDRIRCGPLTELSPARTSAVNATVSYRSKWYEIRSSSPDAMSASTDPSLAWNWVTEILGRLFVATVELWIESSTRCEASAANRRHIVRIRPMNRCRDPKDASSPKLRREMTLGVLSPGSFLLVLSSLRSGACRVIAGT